MLDVLFCGVLIGTGCGRPPDTGSPRQLTVAVQADVTGFFPNPPMHNEGYSLQVNSYIFEGLVGWDRQYRLVPAIAERWTNPDDRTYLLDLRSDLRFSDGRPVTAGDVVASLEATVRHGWPTAGYLKDIESVEALGDRRVRIRSRVANPTLLATLPLGFVLPAAVVDQDPVPVLGTGPYRLTTWTPGRGFSFELNPHYRGPVPTFSRVRFVVEPDDDERLNLVLRGAADVADSVPLAAIPRLQEREGVRLVVRESTRVLTLSLRVDEPPFSNPLVRAAVDLAIDRKMLIDRVFQGHASPASQIVTSKAAGFNPNLPLPEANRDRARQLLAEAGRPHGLDVRLDGPSNRYVSDEQVLEEIARQLREIGIRATANASDKRDFFALIGAGRSKLFLLGWATDAGDAGPPLAALAHSPRGETWGRSNYVGLADPELDAMIELSDSSGTMTERTKHLQAALFHLAQMRVFLPLYIQTEALLISNRIEWDPPVDAMLRPAEMRLAEGSPTGR